MAEIRNICEEIEIAIYSDEKLTQEQLNHIENCEGCKALLSQISSMKNDLSQLSVPGIRDGQISDAVIEKIVKEKSSISFPKFNITHHLGTAAAVVIILVAALIIKNPSTDISSEMVAENGAVTESAQDTTKTPPLPVQFIYGTSDEETKEAAGTVTPEESIVEDAEESQDTSGEVMMFRAAPRSVEEKTEEALPEEYVTYNYSYTDDSISEEDIYDEEAEIFAEDAITEEAAEEEAPAQKFTAPSKAKTTDESENDFSDTTYAENSNAALFADEDSVKEFATDGISDLQGTAENTDKIPYSGGGGGGGSSAQNAKIFAMEDFGDDLYENIEIANRIFFELSGIPDYFKAENFESNEDFLKAIENFTFVLEN